MTWPCSSCLKFGAERQFFGGETYWNHYKVRLTLNLSVNEGYTVAGIILTVYLTQQLNIYAWNLRQYLQQSFLCTFPALLPIKTKYDWIVSVWVKGKSSVDHWPLFGNLWQRYICQFGRGKTCRNQCLPPLIRRYASWWNMWPRLGVPSSSCSTQKRIAIW